MSTPKARPQLDVELSLFGMGHVRYFHEREIVLPVIFLLPFYFLLTIFFIFFLYYNFFSNLLTVAWLTKQAHWLRNSKKLALSTFMGSGYFSSYAKVHRTLASLLCFCSHSCIILIGVCCQNQNYLWKSTKNHYNTNNAFFFLFNSYSNFCFVLK